ncbi:MAG: hypothetical protein KKF56_02040 [Nanoarchaeota archaeon]|nr:hypothetical protein [Nanoarchaeota archaeon]
MNIKARAIRNGIIAVLIVIAVNLLVLYLLDFPIMALDIISKYIILLVLLIGGFGFQIGLFTYFNGISAISCGTSVVSGGISTVSMILCCSHYILNILPFLGAFIGVTAFTFLADYTVYFLWLGIISNVAGISIMYWQKNKKLKGRMKKHE